MLSQTKVALPQLSAFINPATALLTTEADAYDNDVEHEGSSPPDATGLLDLTLGAATAFKGEAMVKRVDHVFTDDANW